MVPTNVSLSEVTLCNDSICEVRGLRIDTPPRRDDGRKDERDRDDRRKEPEGDACLDRRPEPPSQSCNPLQGDESQSVGEDGGRAVAGQVVGDERYDRGNDNVVYGGVGVEDDYNVWRESLIEELVCAQGYLAGMDSLEFMDFQDRKPQTR